MSRASWTSPGRALAVGLIAGAFGSLAQNHFFAVVDALAGA